MLSFVRKLIPNRHPLRLGWHKGKAILAALLYGFPARHLTIIGITGTDGKTTTVGMVSAILEYAGIKHGALSTAVFKIGNNAYGNATQKTSPSPFHIQKFLRDSVRAGCTHAVLEYSSHGLAQGRLNFTWPQVAAITNITPEHLDYHGTMEQYRRDKEKIFEMMRKSGTCIKNVEHRIPNIELLIPGTFNQENANIAIACTEAIGIPRNTAIEALKTFTGIPGRMEQIQKEPFSVFIDFTVTPVAYQKTLSAARALSEPGKRLLVLTGSCGDRMKEKRPQVGKICGEYADVVVVTNEDPYTENPEKIIDEVWTGIDQSQCKAHRIPDRREAIRFILSQTHPGDTVILCGKGSDTTMWTAQGQIPWNEREIVRGML
ncbi:hypothetical protein HYZ98_00530 [Candidatus Peregrinibacteria bacterium]|nr:hypothetical protein [Candidatus Peregrinibacteria bacterium]